MINKFFLSVCVVLFISLHAHSQYMGCPETLTGICPPGTPIMDTASTSQKSASLGTKTQTVNESILDTTQTIEKQNLLSGGQDDLSMAKVAKVNSPTPTGAISSVKEGDEPIENPNESVINAEQNKMVNDAGTLATINYQKALEAYERQAETIEMLANVLFFKSQLAELKKVADKIETVVPSGEESDENLNTAFRGNAALRVVWSQLLTYKQQVIALRLKLKALDMKRKMRVLTTPILEGEEPEKNGDADKTV